MKPAYVHTNANDVFFGQVNTNGVVRDLYHTPLGCTIPDYPFLVIRSSNYMTEFVFKSLENARIIAESSHPYAELYREIVRQYDEKVST